MFTLVSAVLIRVAGRPESLRLTTYILSHNELKRGNFTSFRGKDVLSTHCFNQNIRIYYKCINKPKTSFVTKLNYIALHFF